jgi:ketosteroid isomerase-like protein
MSEQENLALIDKGFEAFNNADVATLSQIIAEDAQQHIPGTSPYAGDHKGRDAMLGLYAKLGEASNGTFRAVLQSTKADEDRVIAVYQGQGERNGKQLGTKNTLVFTLKDGLIADIVDTPDDLAAWDDFWS